VTVRDYKRFDLNSFLLDLSSALNNRFQPVIQYNDIHTAWNAWKHIFDECCNTHAPLKTFRTKQVSNTFITPEIRSLMYKRDYLHKKAIQYSDRDLMNDYRRLRNNISLLIDKSKRDHFSNRIHEADGNLSHMWKTIKVALNNTAKRNGETDTELDPDDFNNFFSSIGRQVADSLDDTDDLCHDMPAHEGSFSFTQIRESSIKRLLTALGYTKSNIDILDMDSRLLCLSSSVISCSLTFIINLSLRTSELPDDWKLARVTPIYKNKGNPDEAVNYRPISVLPHIAKLTETCVKVQIVHYSKTSNLITPHQSAYLENHSTITALHKMVNDWYDNINNNLVTVTCFLDLTKCFDTVDHNILLSKLCSYGFDTNALKWIKSYLTDRTQKVRLKSKLSNTQMLNIGVPQGSILGPILFLLFINDLPSCLKFCICCIYADDVTLYFSSTLITDAQTKLQTDLVRITKWFTMNKLLVNVNKSNCMIISSNANTCKLNLNLKINNTQLVQVNSFKLLGIHIDSQLNWKLHLENLLKVLAPKVGILCRLSKLLSSKTLHTIYNTIILPHIDYGISLWGGCASSYILPIQRLQNRAARAITKSYNYCTSVSFLLSNLKIMTVIERYRYFTANLMYKCLHNLSPSYLNSLFQYVSSVHNRETGQTSNMLLYLPKPSLECFKMSFKYAGANLWNLLPQVIKNSASLNIFKRLYKNHSNNISQISSTSK
jgi:hypothetical protein